MKYNQLLTPIELTEDPNDSEARNIEVRSTRAKSQLHKNRELCMLI